jgi:uncharacterized protein YegP (UPF0339 family)
MTAEARFEIHPYGETEKGFRLRAENGEIVHASEGYRDSTDARRGIEDLVRTVDAARSGAADLRLRVVEVET